MSQWHCFCQASLGHLRSDEPVQQRHSSHKFLLFRGRELGSDGTKQPAHPGFAARLDPFTANVSGGQNGLTSIGRIRLAGDEPGRLKGGQGGAMDCRRTPSARARVVTVAGPSRSRRLRADIWDKVNSPRLASSRNRRFSLPGTTRNFAATACVSDVTSHLNIVLSEYIDEFFLNISRSNG